MPGRYTSAAEMAFWLLQQLRQGVKVWLTRQGSGGGALELAGVPPGTHILPPVGALSHADHAALHNGRLVG